jgi:hypothetical protein
VSCVYFHSPDGEAELRRSERAHLAHLTQTISSAFWGFADPARFGRLDRATELLTMNLGPDRTTINPRSYPVGYLHDYHQDAIAERDRYRASTTGIRNQEPERKFLDALNIALSVKGFHLHVAGHDLHTTNIGMNTTLTYGSDIIRFAAKIHGWCEIHPWIEGADRAWFADLIDQGLIAGAYRSGLWYVDGPCEGNPQDHPDRQWSDQGWESVRDLLRSSSTEPVVLSFSGCDQFPRRTTTTWTPTPLPNDWQPDWAIDEALTEWEALSEGGKEHYRLTAQGDQWYELSTGERWAGAMEWLRETQPWANITPDNLGTTTFGPGVTITDLFAPDRDDRVRAACAKEESSP